MAKVLLALAAASSLLGVALGCAHTHVSHHGRWLSEGAGPAAWSYNHNGGDWDGVCATGESQSPIAIVTSNLTAAMPSTGRAQLSFGTAKGLHIINTGHAVQVEWESLEGDNATIPVLGESWGAIFDGEAAEADPESVRMVPVKPLQMHWHSNCEHVVDGDLCPLEQHIVTIVDNTTGAWVPDQCNQGPCLAVFGILVKFQPDVYADGHEFYQTVLGNLPKGTGAAAAVNLTDASLDLNDFLPDNLDYATYSGSLTTPPCSEGVQWHVFLTPRMDLSAAQLAAFEEAMATTQLDAKAACPADELMGEAKAEEVVDLLCKAETGSRTTNRRVMPINDRTILLSAAEA